MGKLTGGSSSDGTSSLIASYAGTLLHEIGHMASGTTDGTLEFESALSRLLGLTAVAALKHQERAA